MSFSLPTSELLLGGEAAPLPCGLYIVSTPMGNSLDITLRALKTLRSVDLIACEDTRVTQKLLHIYGIKKKLVSYHNHNEDKRVTQLVQGLKQGQSVALVSDAGTPLISDPGYVLVTACIQEGIPVTPIPGVSAVTCALSASGFPGSRFCFLGFLPSKRSPRQEALRTLVSNDMVHIFYEAPHRIWESLEDIAKILGERPLVIGRELSKRYEEFLRGSAAQLMSLYPQTAENWRGEMVLMVGTLASSAASDIDVEELKNLLENALKNKSLRDAVDDVVALTGNCRRTVYRMALSLMKGKVF